MAGHSRVRDSFNGEGNKVTDTTEHADGISDARAGEPYTNPYPPGTREYTNYHAGFWSVPRSAVKVQA